MNFKFLHITKYVLIYVYFIVDTALIYWVGGYLVINDSISIGTIVALISYLGMIYGPFSALVNARISFIKVLISYYIYIDLRIDLRS